MRTGMISGGAVSLPAWRSIAYRTSFSTHSEFFAAVDQKRKKTSDLSMCL